MTSVPADPLVATPAGFAQSATGPVPYATTVARPAPRAWAGAAIVAGGVCLVLLGGCFLIGVLCIVSPSLVGANATVTDKSLTGPQAILMLVLYAATLLSFAGAAVMLYLGTRGLLRVLAA